MNDIQQAKLNGCPEHNDYHADCSRCREKHGASAGREEPIAHDPLIVELVDMAERMEYSGQIKPATLLYAVRNEITNLRSALAAERAAPAALHTALDQCLTAATHSDISDAEARDVVKTIASVALARALAADREHSSGQFTPDMVGKKLVFLPRVPLWKRIWWRITKHKPDRPLTATIVHYYNSPCVMLAAEPEKKS